MKNEKNRLQRNFMEKREMFLHKYKILKSIKRNLLLIAANRQRTYCNFPSAGPALSTSEIAIAGSPLVK